MIKIKQKIIFLFLIFFSIYCALTIGLAWDEEFLKIQGKTTLNYLLSLGKIDEDLFRREYYSPIYYSIKYLFVQIFPAKYQIEASYLINLFFSFATLVGIKKLSKKLYKRYLFEWAYPEVAAWCREKGRSYPELNSQGEITESIPRTIKMKY